MGHEGDGDLGVIVTGPPAAGKSMLGTAVARELGTVFPDRDPFTVMVMAHLAWGYPGGPELTWDIWCHVIDLFRSASLPIVAEGQFNVEVTRTRFADYRRRTGVEPIEVHVRASQEVLRSCMQRRFRDEDVYTPRLQSYASGLIAVECEPVLDADPRTSLSIRRSRRRSACQTSWQRSGDFMLASKVLRWQRVSADVQTSEGMETR